MDERTSIRQIYTDERMYNYKYFKQSHDFAKPGASLKIVVKENI